MSGEGDVRRTKTSAQSSGEITEVVKYMSVLRRQSVRPCCKTIKR